MRAVILALASLLASNPSWAQLDCTALFGTAELDLGALRRPPGMSPHEPVRVPVPTQTLTVSCPRDAFMTLAFSASHGTQGFAFGSSGHLEVRIQEALLDGRTVQLRGLPGAETGMPGRMVDRAKPGDRVQPVRDGALAGGMILQLRLEVFAVLMPSQFSIHDLHDLIASLRVQVTAK